jgi:hypothetical protein
MPRPFDPQQEGRISLAIQALISGQFNSIRATARSYDVPRVTLQRRCSGILPQRGSRAATRKLTDNEEDLLEQRVLELDRKGH